MGAATASVAGLLAGSGICLDDRVRHRDVIFNLEVRAHSSGVGDTMAKGTDPAWEVPTNSVEVMDICSFAGSFA